MMETVPMTPASEQLTVQTNDTFVVTQAAAAAMYRHERNERRRRREFREDLKRAFSRGADITPRRITEVNKDSMYKKCTRTQRGKIMG